MNVNNDSEEQDFLEITGNISKDLPEDFNLTNLEDEDDFHIENNEKTAVVTKGRDTNRFPFTRIRSLMKLDPDLTISSQESVFLITKAAVRLFIFYKTSAKYQLLPTV